MRAVGLRRYGPPEVLEVLEVERPEPGPDGVLIRVVAAGVNPADCLLRSGGLRFVARQEMPFVPGADVAGVVEAVGPGVTRFGVGDPVYAMLCPAPPAAATPGTLSPLRGASRPYRRASPSGRPRPCRWPR
jgi:NADPH:quinone reductase-like Zn-dependent oxidoreductase